MKQQGFIILPVLVIVFIIVLLSYIIYRNINFYEIERNADQPATVIQTVVNSESNKPTSHILESYNIAIEEPGWKRLSTNTLGISFDYPFSNVGDVFFSYKDFGENQEDPSGQIYSWEYHVFTPKSNERTYIIASGISSNFSHGSGGWYTYFYKLDSEDYEDSIKIYKTKYDTDAIVKQAENLPTYSYNNDVVILTDLPIKKDERFKGLAIYVNQQLSDIEIQRIINSIVVE